MAITLGVLGAVLIMISVLGLAVAGPDAPAGRAVSALVVGVVALTVALVRSRRALR